MPHPDHSTIEELCAAIVGLHDPESRALDDPRAIADAVRRFAAAQVELVRRAEDIAHQAVMRIEADERWAKRARAAEQRVAELEKAARRVVGCVRRDVPGTAAEAFYGALQELLDQPPVTLGAAEVVVPEPEPTGKTGPHVVKSRHQGHGGGGPAFRGYPGQVKCDDCGHLWFSTHPNSGRKRVSS